MMKNPPASNADARSPGPPSGGGIRGRLAGLLDSCQRRLSLNTQRGLLLLFLLLQALFFGGYLAFVRDRIEDDAARILRNTALLQGEAFETGLEAMRYQVRVIGNALLLNRTVAVSDAEPFIAQELRKDWLDAVIVIDAQGNFVATGSTFPLEQGLSAPVLEQASFKDRPLFKDLRREEVNERLFVWQGNGSDPDFTGFVMYRAVRDPSGRYVGGVVGYQDSTSPGRLFQKLQERGLDLGTGGVMAVVDRENGVQLARMGAGMRHFRRGRAAPSLIEFASDKATAHRYVSSVDGVRRLGVFLNLNERKWVLAIGLAEREVLRGWYAQTALTVLAFIAIGTLQWLLLHYAHANFLQRERLAQEARRDPLTDLANRRYFDEWSNGVCSLARRHQQSLCVLSFDLDFFKRINDTYGHDAGDAVLKQVAQALQQQLRQSDFAARFGGEEFVVALPQTQRDVALQVAERIRASFAAQEVVFNGETIRFTASFGIAQMTPDELEMGEGIHAALARADKALYVSKQEGRNCVTVAC